MDIIWHGHSCFELVSGGYSAVIDPFQDTSVGTAYPHVRLTADAVYISHEDRDHNFREGVTLRSNGKTNPFAVTELETYHDIMRGRLRGMKVRGGSRIINNMLTKLGATPVGMPVPAVTDAITKGVIQGTTIPWEVVPSLKIAEIVKNHTTFSGPQGLFTQTFALTMNKNSYDKLPADLKKVIDANSGVETAALFGRAMDEGDRLGLASAQKLGNKVVTLDAAETARWKAAAAAVEADWVKEVQGKGIDGAKLVSEARALIAKQAK